MTRCGVLFFCAALICGAQDQFAAQREGMVREQIASRGIKNAEVLQGDESRPRILYAARCEIALAYEDRPVPIGYGQTISQPYIVAFMSEALEVRLGPPGAGDRYRVRATRLRFSRPDSGSVLRSRSFRNWRNRRLRP